jgi:Ran GTPase-activating protein 1
LSNNGLGPEGSVIIAEALEEGAKNARRKGLQSRMMGSINPLDNQEQPRAGGSQFKSNLRVVQCGRNRLQMESMTAWGKTFAAHGGLTEVRLYQNGIFAAGFPQLITGGLSSCPDLEHLDLQDNTINEQGSAALAKALPSWPKLKVLNVSECYLTSRGGQAIFKALNTGGNRELTTLNLQFAELDEKAIKILASSILEHLPNLKSLMLNGNIADPDGKTIQEVRDALEEHGHDDALDELDEMEEPGEEAEDREEEEERRLDEVGEDEKELREKLKEGAKDQSVDDLANLLGKTSLS